MTTNYRDMVPAQPTLSVPGELTHEEESLPDTSDMLEILSSHPAEAPVVEIIWERRSHDDLYVGDDRPAQGCHVNLRQCVVYRRLGCSVQAFRMDEISLAVMPIFHIAGNLLGICTPAYSGSTTVFSPVPIRKPSWRLSPCTGVRHGMLSPPCCWP